MEDMLEGVLDVVVPAKLEEGRGDVEGLRFRFGPELGLVQVEDVLLALHALVYLEALDEAALVLFKGQLEVGLEQAP